MYQVLPYYLKYYVIFISYWYTLQEAIILFVN